MNLEDLYREITALKEEASRSEKREEKLKKVLELHEAYSTAMRDLLSTHVKIQVKNKSLTGRYKDMVEDLYTQMTKGTQVTMDLVSNIYPGLAYNSRYHILMTLQRMPHVQLTKDGRNLRLFYHEPN